MSIGNTDECGYAGAVAAVRELSCQGRIADTSPVDGTPQDTDEWQSDWGSHPAQAAVRQGSRAWARDTNGDGRRAGQCKTCEGAGTVIRPSWRGFSGVHKPYLQLAVATSEARVQAKGITPALMRRMCWR